MPNAVQVTILGSGDAFGSGGRLHSAYLIEAPSATFLVDCGTTVLQGLKRADVKTTQTHETLKGISAPSDEPSKPRAQSRKAA